MYIIYISEQWIVKVTQLCPVLCNPMDYTVPGILQARILEWVAFPFSRGSSQPRDRIQVSSMAGGFFTSWTTREAQEYWSGWPTPSSADVPNPGKSPREGNGYPLFLPGRSHGQRSLALSHKGSPRILEWVAYPFSSGSSPLGNGTGVSCIAGRFFTNWAIR